MNKTEAHKHWSALTYRKKTEWLATEIMNWPWFASLEAIYQHEHLAPFLASGQTEGIFPFVHWDRKVRIGQCYYIGSKGKVDVRPFAPLECLSVTGEILQAVQERNLDLFNRVAHLLIPRGYQHMGQGILLASLLQWTPEQVCATLYAEWHAQKMNEAMAEIVRISEDAGLYDLEKKGTSDDC